MSYSPLLVLHICAGTLGFVSGAVAMSLRKGSRRHALAGDVFVVTMLTMAASGAYMALMKSQMGNFLGGVFTFYLVATAWWTAKRTEGKTDSADWIALLCVSAVVIGNLIYGIEAARSATGMKGGYPAPIYFFGGTVALIAAIGDIRLLMGRGISGTQRIARHLWRMCYALFVASGSIFLARAHLFPADLRRTGILFILSFMPLALMIFWLIRVRVLPKFRKKPLPRAAASFAFRTNLRHAAGPEKW
jgi:uncharacterized membrane protein